MWHTHQGMGWWMLFGGILWFAFLAVIVWLLLSLVASGARQGAERRQGGPEDPRDIARRRYAGGEISREEYQQIISDLDTS